MKCVSAPPNTNETLPPHKNVSNGRLISMIVVICYATVITTAIEVIGTIAFHRIMMSFPIIHGIYIECNYPSKFYKNLPLPVLKELNGK